MNKRSRVLVVDDAAGMRTYLQTILTAAGYECQLATNGVEAFESILANKVDLVITDIAMPHMNGLQLLAAIGLLRSSRRPPVIVLSARVDIETARQREELRLATDLLEKPVNLAKLLQRVAATIHARVQTP